MASRRFHVIPTTRGWALVNMVIGAALLVQAIVELHTGTVRAPALEVAVAVIGGVLILCAMVGLVRPSNQ